VPITAKTFEYAVEVDLAGRMTIPGGGQFVPPEGWSADHLLLAALVRCSLKSLGFHARRKSVEMHSASGSSRTLVTQRETDDRYALVDTQVELAVELAPEPEPDTLSELLSLAERDCFVGSSLTAKPSYRWVVNGRTVGT